MNKVNETWPIVNWTISYRWQDIDLISYQDVLPPISEFSRTLEQLDLDSTDIYELSSDFLLVKVQKSKSDNYRAMNDEAYSTSLKWTSKMSPHKVDGKYQVWEILGGFKYSDFEYFVISNTYELTNETLPERGIYRWVIVNPELYFSDEAQNQVGDWVEKTRGVLDWK